MEKRFDYTLEKPGKTRSLKVGNK